MNARLTPLVLVGLVLTLAGCDKLKSVAGGSAEGGTVGSGFSFFEPDFEGEISLKLTSAAKAATAQSPGTIVVGIKKPKYRMDMVGTPQNPAAITGSFLLDLPTKKGWMLLHAQKLAMEVDLEKVKSMKGSLPGMPAAPNGVPTVVPSTPPKIEKTGKKDAIAGYSCEVWNITIESKRSEVCMADGLSWIDMSDLGMTSPEIAIGAIASEGNRFPLRVIGFDAKGAEDFRMEAQKIEKKPLLPAGFEPPADYRRMPFLLPGLPALPTGLPSKR